MLNGTLAECLLHDQIDGRVQLSVRETGKKIWRTVDEVVVLAVDEGKGGHVVASSLPAAQAMQTDVL